ncbi:MAG: hypothetical protein KDI38_25825, partial [Calditrichaeota bacterium]|nr:hypothetical protein [Calditrichota bacterium]
VTNLDSVFADPDLGTVLSYSAASNNSNMQVSVQNKSLIVNSSANTFGSAQITVTATDGGGLSGNDIFNLNITPVNDPPVVAGIPDVNFPEDGSTTLDLDPYASDIDNDPATLTWSANVIAAQAGTLAERGKSGKDGTSGIEVDPGDLQISINPISHIASFTSTADTSGIFTVVFSAADPGGLSDSDTILVTVSSANDPPYVANPISDRSYAEDSGSHMVVTDLDSVFADPDPGAVLSYSAASNNGNVQLLVQNKSLTVTSAPNAFGSALITVTATDGGGLSVNDIFNLNITPVNDPPVVAGIPNVNFPEDGSTTLDLSPYASDIDNDPATLTWSANVIAAQAGTQPEQGKSGKDGVSGIEVDPGDLQISINPVSHVATFTSTADTNGIFTVAFSASDPGGLSDSDTILVTVISANDPPYVANPISDRSYAEDSGPHTVVTDLDSVFADPDPGTLFSYSAASNSGNVQVSVQNKSLIVNFAANAVGNALITVTANDGGLSVHDQFNLQITPVNDPPVVTGIPNVNFPEDSSATLDLDPYAGDIDNDPASLTWSADVIAAQPLNQPGQGPQSKTGKPGVNGIEVDPSDLQVSINPATHVATFTSSVDTTGIFTVVFTATDPGGLSDSDTILVTVAGANDLPYVAN